jgi:hypothetical protein
MKGILIGRKIYINVRDGHAKNWSCSQLLEQTSQL